MNTSTFGCLAFQSLDFERRNMSRALNVISMCGFFCTDINTGLENHFKHVKLV